MLELRHVSVMRGETEVLHDLDLRVADGEYLAILGPNGCGKSTLVGLLARDLYPLARPETRLRLFGRDTWEVSELRSLVGLVSNDLAALQARPITGLEAVLSGFFGSIGLWPHHEVTGEMRREAAAALERAEVSHLAARRVNELSSGEARRLLVARALIHHPRALLFDEPTNSLDLRAQAAFREQMRVLARQGLGIVLVTHLLADIIPEIERVVLMRAGRIVGDGPKAELLTADRLGELFGVRCELAVRDGYYHLW